MYRLCDRDWTPQALAHLGGLVVAKSPIHKQCVTAVPFRVGLITPDYRQLLTVETGQMALLAISVTRISIAAFWLLSPPVLAVLALRGCKRDNQDTKLKRCFSLFASVGVLSNWILFVAFVCAGLIGGFGTHYMTTRLADVFVWFSILVLMVSAVARPGRWQLVSASLLLLGLWFGSEMVA